jgi:hypothetical protein
MDTRDNVGSSTEPEFFESFAHPLFDALHAFGLFEPVFVKNVEHMRDRDHIADVYDSLTEVCELQSVDEGRLRRGGEIHRDKNAVPY